MTSHCILLYNSSFGSHNILSPDMTFYHDDQFWFNNSWLRDLLSYDILLHDTWSHVILLHSILLYNSWSHYVTWHYVVQYVILHFARQSLVTFGHMTFCSTIRHLTFGCRIFCPTSLRHLIFGLMTFYHDGQFWSNDVWLRVVS